MLGDVGRLLADAIAPLWEDAMSTLVTGIAELVTNDPSLGTSLGRRRRCVVDDGSVAWVGPRPDAPAGRPRGSTSAAAR